MIKLLSLEYDGHQYTAVVEDTEAPEGCQPPPIIERFSNVLKERLKAYLEGPKTDIHYRNMGRKPVQQKLF